MRISLRYVLSLLALFGLSAAAAAQAQVTPERIERAAAEPQNWLTQSAHGIVLFLGLGKLRGDLP